MPYILLLSPRSSEGGCSMLGFSRKPLVEKLWREKVLERERDLRLSLCAFILEFLSVGQKFGRCE